MATTREIAKVAQVSLGTVSRYMNGHALKESTREKIERAIEKIEGRVIRRLNIGIMLPVVNESFSGTILQEVQNNIRLHGHNLLLFSSKYMEEDQEYLLSSEIDGVIIHPARKEDLEIIRAINQQIPVILVDVFTPDIACDQILIDNIHAMYQGVEHLIQNNHTNILLACSEKEVIMHEERVEGYRRVLQDYCIPYSDENMIDAGDLVKLEESLKVLMQQENRPTAMVSINQGTNVNCLKAFKALGVRVPQDFSYIGFDDFGISNFSTNYPYFIVQPMEEMGQIIVETIIKRIQGDFSNFPSLNRLKTQLQLGDSISTR